MLKYSSRRLETCAHCEFCRVRIAIFVFGKFFLCISTDALQRSQFIIYIFQEPNPEDPLNKEAAEELQNARRLFEQHVQKAMRGGYVGSNYFERCLK